MNEEELTKEAFEIFEKIYGDDLDNVLITLRRGFKEMFVDGYIKALHNERKNNGKD